MHNCKYCKKEIADGCIYCAHCSEKLANKQDIKLISIYEVDNQRGYKGIGNKTTAKGRKVKKNLHRYIDKIKSFALKNKIASIIIGVVLALLIVAICIINSMQGRPLNESELQKKIVGQSLEISGESYEIKENELKFFEITSRKSENKKNDEIQGKLTLNLDNATVITDIDFKLSYNKNINKWEIDTLSTIDIESAEPKKSLNDTINDLLKNITINYKDKKNHKINLNDKIVKSINNINFNRTGADSNGSAYLKLSNGVVEGTFMVNFEATFNLKEGNWVLKTNDLDAKVIESEKLVGNLSDEDKKKFVMTAFTEDDSYPYKYKLGNKDTVEDINLNRENISTLKVNNFTQSNADTIKAEVQGEAVSGDMTKINFSGVIYWESLLADGGNNEVEVNVDYIELANINLNNIRKDMIEDKLDNKTITIATADTLKLGVETKDSSMFDKIYEGVLTDDRENKNVTIEVKLEYNDKDKKYEWKLYKLKTIKK